MAERTEHLEAVLLSAVRPSQEQEKRFLAFLAEKYGEGTTLTWQKSDDYPDGFRLEVGAEVYDWSAGGRLSQFKDALEKLQPPEERDLIIGLDINAFPMSYVTNGEF